MNKSTLGKLDVVSVIISWALLFSFICSLIYFKVFSESGSNASVMLYIFGAFFITVLTHIVLAYFNRCPHCNKCLTIQGLKEPHTASSGSWDKVVWHWFSGSVVCIHCGKKVATNGL